jgi:hypothetical protein
MIDKDSRQELAPSPKRSRGRPKKTVGEPTPYRHILVETSLPPDLLTPDPVCYTDEQRQHRVRACLDKVRAVLAYEATAEYYWQLVFSAAFYCYRQQKQAEAMRTDGLHVPSVSLRQMAEEAGLAYLNLKNLFRGRGTAKNLFCFLRFLHARSIDFDALQYNEFLIDRAYQLLTVERAA